MTLVGKCEAILGGQTISYVIKRSSKAKYVRLEVRSETGLTIVIPRSYKSDRIPDVLRKKQRWILGKLAKYGQVQPPESGKALKGGDTIPYLGRDLEVVTRRSYRNVESLIVERNRLVVSLRAGSNSLDIVLERWYRVQAAELIREKVNKLGADLGFTFGQLTIRGQKTRWGSCSRMGNLSFNWKLLMAPEPVIDYVVIHELSHLREMNHSSRFWHLVHRYCSHWREMKNWLETHEADLTAGLLAGQ